MSENNQFFIAKLIYDVDSIKNWKKAKFNFLIKKIGLVDCAKTTGCDLNIRKVIFIRCGGQKGEEENPLK